MSKKLIIILVNFIIILVVSLLVVGQINEYKGLKSVYVAKVDIRKGVKVTPQMIEVKKITLNQPGKNQKNKKYVTYYSDVITKTQDVVGQYAQYDMIVGEIILKDKITKKGNIADQYLYDLPKGYYAYPISLKEETGLIKVNDYIDLFIYIEGQGIIDEPALRHLRVYDLRAEGISTEVVSNQKAEKKAPTHAIVAINNYQISKLIDYKHQKADFTIALRKRPNSVYEVLDNSNIASIEYPVWAINDIEIIDEIREQQLIDDNRIIIDNESLDKQNMPIKETKTTSNTSGNINVTNTPETTNTPNSANTVAP